MKLIFIFSLSKYSRTRIAQIISHIAIFFGCPSLDFWISGLSMTKKNNDCLDGPIVEKRKGDFKIFVNIKIIRYVDISTLDM